MSIIKDYKFKDIEKYLKKDSNVGKDIIEAFKHLSDAAIIFAPIILGPKFLILLDLLEVKDKLFDLGHKVYNFIAEKNENDYLERMEQIRAAYALICYTAYFDVFQDAIPKEVRKRLKLKWKTKKDEFKDSIEEIEENLQSTMAIEDIRCEVFLVDYVTSLLEIKEKLTEIYKHISSNLIKIIRDLSIFDEDNEEDKQEFENLSEVIDKLPQKAIKAYEAQYLQLADKFNDFALFSQLKNLEGINHAIKKNREAVELVISTTDKIDVGLTNLNNIVNSIATDYNAIQAQDIIDDLKKKYVASIEEPIIDDREIKSDNEMMSLRFPKIVDAFIPQSYKCLSYQRNDIKLEDRTIWEKTPVRHDLDKFFIEYLYSLDSINYPLIILGQPGSGKSLLTKVLSAQLMSNAYTVIRIPLREVNAEDGIDILVEDQIKKITNRSLSTQGYGGFATQFKDRPLIIILDGYDELLQAKGNVFSGYLEKIRTFQQDQKSMGRAVRIIITSRITLIDKARIPIKSTILRLLEFNSHQRQKWIDIWNENNADYFQCNKIKSFSLPPEEKNKKNSIIELAEQPLLLLMLALYDSESNELKKTSNIKRTELYDNLLRRFVRRERRRYILEFENKCSEEQEEIIDKEMNRLGVVAIGMYNRQEVVIRSRQLEDDLDLFNARRNDDNLALHTLKESESVLGSFFFIHKSTAKDLDAHSDNSESAYEFLHNTFGEFLAADFILRNTINEVKDIFIDRKFKSSGLENKLTNPDSLNSGWFYCLMFEPLFSRPVVIEMLREHLTKALKHTLEKYKVSIDITESDFIDNLQYLVKNQLKMILNTRNSPSVMRGGILLERDISLLGYLSTYSLNLVILACILSPNGFELNEQDYTNSKNYDLEFKAWDKLISLWKGWFSPADLMGLSVILRARRTTDTTVLIECHKKFKATRYEQPIDILLCMSFTLGDNLLTGLSGLMTQKFCEITQMDNKMICKMFSNEHPDIYVLHLINIVRKAMNGFVDEKKSPQEYIINYKEVNEIIYCIINCKQIYTINSNTMLNLFEVLEYGLMRKLIFASIRKQLIKIIPQLITDSKYFIKKIHNHLEYVSGVRLMKLLIKNTELLYLVKFNDPYLNRICMDSEVRIDLERFLRYSSHHMRDNVFFIQDYNENNLYETSLFSAINGIHDMSKGEQRQMLIRFFGFDNIDVLFEANPEFLSRAILALQKSDEIEQKEIDSIVDVFLHKCIDQLHSIGIYYVGLDTIISAISIAKNNKSKWFLLEVCNVLQRKIINTHPRLFWNIVFLYPKYIADLIEIMPEIFTGIRLEIYEAHIFEKTVHYACFGKMIDYIRVFKCLYQLNYDGGENKEILPRGLMLLERTIKQFGKFNEFRFCELTIDQIEDLIWYSNVTINEPMAEQIKSDLKRYIEDHKYMKNSVSELLNL